MVSSTKIAVVLGNSASDGANTLGQVCGGRHCGGKPKPKTRALFDTSNSVGGGCLHVWCFCFWKSGVGKPPSPKQPLLEIISLNI